MTDENENVAVFSLKDGTHWRLVGWGRIERWIDEMETAWEWVQNEPRLNDPSGGYTGYILSRVTDLRRSVLEHKANGAPASSFADIVKQVMDDYSPFHQDSDNGQLVFDIRQAKGADAAIFAFHLLRNRVNPTQANSLAFMQGAMLAAEPSLIPVNARSEAFKSERSNFRRAANAVREEYDLADARRLVEWQEAVRRGDQEAKELARRLVRRWLRYSIRARSKERAAMAKLRATDAAFTEQMGLKAPVKYWKDKADTHRGQEFWARIWVILFFAVTLPGMAYVFIRTGVVLIDHAMAIRPQGAPPFPNAVFLIASAGLASCAGVVFWAGRLLTKLYLSQHHLRQDAEERATMTETYLALIENSAASAEDRQVILNALFRNTPDGIVKEEGGLDPSIAAALGKFLAKP